MLTQASIGYKLNIIATVAYKCCADCSYLAYFHDYNEL